MAVQVVSIHFAQGGPYVGIVYNSDFDAVYESRPYPTQAQAQADAERWLAAQGGGGH